MSANPDKAALRRTLRQRRAALDIASRRQASLAIMQRALQNGYLRRGSRIAVYAPMGSELSTWPLILRAIQAGCQVFLPQIPRRGRQMRFVRFDETVSWRRDQFNIPVPIHPQTCVARDLSLVFVPLVGFDQRLARLGQGGGYYDTTFRFRRSRKIWKKPRLIGLAYECQRVKALPVEPWDLHLDEIITENNTYRPPA